MAAADGAWVAPHQSGGPVATAVCLQLAACVPNFLVQEYFDPFNEPWTTDLVTWARRSTRHRRALAARRARPGCRPQPRRRPGPPL